MQRQYLRSSTIWGTVTHRGPSNSTLTVALVPEGSASWNAGRAGMGLGTTRPTFCTQEALAAEADPGAACS